MTDLSSTRLESREVGAAPIIDAMFERLDVEGLLTASIPEKATGRPADIPPAKVVRALISNVLLSRHPLYAIPAWLSGFLPESFGLRGIDRDVFNDDRIGRSLNWLFEAEHASLVVGLVLKAVKVFDIDMSRMHNDTTTVTFSGKYEEQSEESAAPWITFGYNKDHRPDLKQLVYSLTVSADGAVPVHFKTYDGNTSDDQTYVETWETLCQLVGNADFLYVADSKLCVSASMRHIAGKGGRFLTVMPRTRSEDGWFRTDYLLNQLVDWREVRRDRNRCGKNDPDNTYHGFESPRRSAEGYRILWYKSSTKVRDDQQRRFQRIGDARRRIEALLLKRGRGKLKTTAAAQKAADQIIDDLGVGAFLEARAVLRVFHTYRQARRGRPRADTHYEREPVERIDFQFKENAEAIQAAAAADGLFPLITNDNSMTPAEALDKYKYQPFLEKRNEQLKSVLLVAPVHLRNPERIASLLCVYFISLLLYALLEREIRHKMEKHKIPSLPLYPEERLCKRPTANLALTAFAGIRRHRLLDDQGRVLKVFHDPLPPVCQLLLKLLDIDPAHYGAPALAKPEKLYNELCGK